jgi:hypothetical protein
MSRKRRRKRTASIPEDVKAEVEEIVESFNRKNSRRDDCFYQVQFSGKHCYLNRSDYGRLGPICRLTYTGKMDDWKFVIFKWSSETYAPDEWYFPGCELVDGTIEGAMRAGLEAYPV